MIVLGDRPLLFHNLEWLRDWGCSDVFINLHHQPEAVTSVLGDGSALGVRVRYSHEPDLLGTAGALRPFAAHLADAVFLVVYADNIIRCDLGRLTSRHAAVGSVMTVALHWRSDVSSSGVAVLDRDDRITRFVEKPKDASIASNWVNAGLYVCEPSILTHLSGTGPLDFGREVIPALIGAGQRVHGYRMGRDESLLWIDTPADLEHARSMIAGAPR